MFENPWPLIGLVSAAVVLQQIWSLRDNVTIEKAFYTEVASNAEFKASMEKRVKKLEDRDGKEDRESPEHGEE